MKPTLDQVKVIYLWRHDANFDSIHTIFKIPTEPIHVSVSSHLFNVALYMLTCQDK